jgi:hypothetical protein
MTAQLRLVPDDRDLAAIEAEIDLIWSEIEPLLRAHDALQRRAIELREMSDD